MRILICEDAVLLREGLVRLLEDAGHEVVAALPDIEGLDLAVANTTPDLCILDVRLPRRSPMKASVPLSDCVPRIRRWRSSCSRSTSRSATPRI